MKILAFLLFLCSPVVAGNLTVLIDDHDRFYFTDEGIEIHHLSGAKPGNYGDAYDIQGPILIGGMCKCYYAHSLYPIWSLPVEDRSEDWSEPMKIVFYDVNEIKDFSLADKMFNSNDPILDVIDSFHSPGWINLNRGIVTYGTDAIGDYIDIYDPIGGQNWYSVNFVPEPASLSLILLGAMFVFPVKNKRIKK